MKATASQQPIHSDWKILYRAAVLEPDKDVIRQKIAEAESAVLYRARELFYSGGTIEEKESLEDALYILRAYKNACGYARTDIPTTAAEAA